MERLRLTPEEREMIKKMREDELLRKAVLNYFKALSGTD